MYRVLDESPKWLLATGQREKADQLLRKIAEYNGQTYDENDLLDKERAIEEEKPSVSLYASWGKFLKNPITLAFLVICVFAWYVYPT